MGKGEDWTREETRKALARMFSQQAGNISPSGPGAIEYITFTNGPKTKGKTDSGFDVDTIPTGALRQREIGYRTPNGKYLVKGRPVKVLGIDSSSNTVYILYRDFDVNTFYISKTIGTGSPITTSFNVHTIMNDGNNASLLNVKFSINGRAIVVGGYDDVSDPNLITFYWGIITEFEVTVIDGVPTLTYDAIYNGSYNFNLADVPIPDQPPEPSFEANLSNPQTGILSEVWEEDIDPVIPGNITSIIVTPRDFVVSSNVVTYNGNNLGYAIDFLCNFTTEKSTYKAIREQSVTYDSPVGTVNYSYAAFSSGVRVVTYSGGISGTVNQKNQQVFVTRNNLPSTQIVWWGNGFLPIDDPTGVVTGTAGNNYYQAGDLLSNTSPADQPVFVLENTDSYYGVLSLNNTNSDTPTLVANAIGSQTVRTGNGQGLTYPQTPPTPDITAWAYWLDGVASRNVTFRHTDSDNDIQLGQRYGSSTYSILSIDGVEYRSNPYTTPVDLLSDVPSVISPTLVYYDTSDFNNYDYVKTISNNYFMGILNDTTVSTFIENGGIVRKGKTGSGSTGLALYDWYIK